MVATKDCRSQLGGRGEVSGDADIRKCLKCRG